MSTCQNYGKQASGRPLATAPTNFYNMQTVIEITAGDW